ncbi:hypothetical protein HNY42_02810 [Exiguobacterium sp. Helios]|jgi:HPt (histidine-containing phosphotransfer) domain-containing protein|uniref:Uncharacterized protein n=1 Tax=Exiguobacterium antarcticum TaxID=132920 RepID=A0ABT6R5E8_9BACL|nr:MULTISPECIES: hypothetical protein [Exiguobacterium]AFS69413.1 hypothetical protein Eab7_0251 [Exiguobacterium antarcticum B7]MCT4781362.1 hypothetical protein [Exiguobacterium soli]MDI3236043.1 hypothetical protein [Exiguobacterium antarcticum]OIN66678.1 hypothetical protein BLD48_09135 [Exiguobacterium sp. KRL4]QNR19917.1 hypothetical protein HNY42_02810 [Exiguobacterium sp. Helios]
MAFEQTVKEMEQMLEEDWFEWLENDEPKYNEWRDQLEALAEQVMTEYNSKVDSDAIDSLLLINEDLPVLYGEDTVMLYTALLHARKEDDSVYERYLTILGAFSEENHPALREVEQAVAKKDYKTAYARAVKLPQSLGLE